MKNGINTHSSGFTLIELLIVVVILSTLASIVAPNFYSLGDRGKITAANTTVQNIQKKITAYRTLNDHWPTDIDNSWFIHKKYPRSPFATNYTGNTINVNDSPAKWHPRFKTLGQYPPFWYCRGNGSFRIRVPAQATDTETLELYNSANMSNVTNLNSQSE